MDVINSEYRAIQHSLVDKILRLLFYVSVPLLGLSLLRILDGGWQPVMGLHIFVVSLFGIIYGLRNNCSFTAKSLVLILAFFALSIGAVLTNQKVVHGTSSFLMVITLTMFLFGVLPTVWMIIVGIALQLGYAIYIDELNIQTLLEILALPLMGAVVIYVIEAVTQTLMLTLKTLAYQKSELSSAKKLVLLASNAKSDFLAKMSHELRTPMHGILGYANLGIEKAETMSWEKSAKYFNQIKVSGERLLILLNDLLDISKLQSGQLEVHFEPAALRDVVMNSVIDHGEVLEQKQIRVKWAGEHAEDGSGVFDPARITQVIANLLSNAIRFSPEGGEITVAISRCALKGEQRDETPGYMFSMQDQGDGIPEDDLDSVFDIFYSISGSKMYSPGAGVGLSISREIIDLHGGRIWAENHAEGGAVLRFIIPTSQPVKHRTARHQA